MRIRIAAIGKAARGGPESALCEDYLKRANQLGPKLGFGKLDLSVFDTSRKQDAVLRMAEEAALLTAKLSPGAHLIELDEGGRSFTSEAFAAELVRLRVQGIPELAFAIGGPDGLAPELRKRAKTALAFGSQTWPHLLVRAMLAEQLYRAFSILSRHPYHRGRAGNGTAWGFIKHKARM